MPTVLVGDRMNRYQGESLVATQTSAVSMVIQHVRSVAGSLGKPLHALRQGSRPTGDDSVTVRARPAALGDRLDLRMARSRWFADSLGAVLRDVHGLNTLPPRGVRRSAYHDCCHQGVLETSL